MLDLQSLSVTKKYTDLSTEDHFRFAFYCERCGAPTNSEVYNFPTNTYAYPPRGRALSMLWNRFHKAAFERAVIEARGEFNICPICGRRVCEQCFFVNAGEITDVCYDCLPEMIRREQMQSTGT